MLCIAQSGAVAQKVSAQRTVAVVVADAHTDPTQPVPTVRISLSYLDGSVLVTEARDVTNPKGQAWLDVSEDAAQRGGLRIEIAGATNLVIYQPADGQLPALPATINVSMLPKGSPLLLGPAGIQAMMRRMSYEISSLQRKNGALASTANAAVASTPATRLNAAAFLSIEADLSNLSLESAGYRRSRSRAQPTVCLAYE